MSRANIRDVAARAGVAVKTVSRVLNGHPYVSDALRERVEAAMAELDYRPSIAARILSGAKSNQVALIYDNHSPYYMFQIQKGCWEVCHENGIRLLAQPVDVADPRVGDQVRGLVSETHVDGIILSSPVTDCDPVLRALEGMDVPFVRISPGTPGRANTRAPPADDVRRRSRSMPGAVPSGLAMIRLPRGKSACRRFDSGHGTARRANRASTSAKAAAERSSGTPATRARTSRVRSSAVGPSPPVTTMISARSAAMRKAAIPSSRLSVIVV
jgi:LacI family transcriptional regulator